MRRNSLPQLRQQALRRFSVQPIRLDAATEKHLLDCLFPNGMRISQTTRPRVIDEIERALALGGREVARHFNAVPRASDYQSVFGDLRAKAHQLYEDICELGDYYRDQFESRGINLHEIELSLAHVLDVAADVQSKFENIGSRGRGENNALPEVVRRLRTIFRQYYKGEVGRRKRIGAFVTQSPGEVAEFEFVKRALIDAKLIPSGYTGLEKLMRDRRCAISGEK